MLFSLCNVTYTIENYKPTILLFARDENKEKHLIKVQYDPYFYINSWDWNRVNIILGNSYYQLTTKEGIKDIPLINYIESHDLELKVRGDPDSQLRKIVATYPKHVGEMNKILTDKHHIPTYEADVLFYLRFLIDTGITTGFEIKRDKVPTVYNAVPKELIPTDVESKHRMGFIDIETYGADASAFENYKAPLKVVSIYDNYTDTYYQFYVLDQDIDMSSYNFVHPSKYIGKSYKDERDLLIALRDFLSICNFDVMISFTLFDMDYVLRRMKINTLNMDSLSLCGRVFEKTGKALKQEKDSFNKRKKTLITIPDMETLDIADVYKRFKGEMAFHNLDYVGKLELKLPKIPITSVYDYWNKKLYRETLVYNLRDTEIIKELEQKMGLISYFLEPIRRIVGCTFNHALIPTKVSDILYLRLVKKKNIALRTKSPFPLTSKAMEQLLENKNILDYKGAHVYKPESGIINNVAVFDWSELYPSVITTYNIGWNTYRSYDSDYKVAGVYNFTKDEDSWTKLILAQLRKARQEVKKEIKQTSDKEKKALLKARSSGMKAIINAVYGAYGFKGEWDRLYVQAPSRLYSNQIAEAVTLGGQELELEGGNYLTKELGYTLLQGDTDSLFIKLKSNEPRKEAEELRDKLESHIKNFVRTKYHMEDVPLSVELDKIYDTLIMFGIKKRYHGISDGDVEYKGIEALRKDTAEITGELQMAIGNLVFKNPEKPPKKEIQKLIYDSLMNILKGEISLDKIMVKGKCSKTSYERRDRNQCAIIVGNKKLGQNITVGSRFYWIYLYPFRFWWEDELGKPKTQMMKEIGSLVPYLPNDVMKTVDWDAMANYAIVNPLTKYCKVLGIDIKTIYNNVKHDMDKQSYLTSFM